MRSSLNACLILLALGGCATQPKEYAGPDAGTVVVSVTTADSSVNPWLFFRRQGTTAVTTITWDTTGAIPGKFSDDTSLGIVRAIRLPPGRYEIHAFQFNYAGTTIGSVTPAFAPFPFVVEAGRVTYAGSYGVALRLARPEQVKTQGNVTTVPDTAMDFTVLPVDRRERDLGIATAIDPRLASATVHAALPATSAALVFRLR